MNVSVWQHTVFALLGSTVTTFGVSALMEKKIRPVDIQVCRVPYLPLYTAASSTGKLTQRYRATECVLTQLWGAAERDTGRRCRNRCYR